MASTEDQQRSARTPEQLPLPQGPNVREQPALDVATEDDVEDGEFEAQEYDSDSAASASIRSSILEHEYEHGRRVRLIASPSNLAVPTNSSEISTITIGMDDIRSPMTTLSKDGIT